MSEVELYNKIYTDNPHKWAADWRNMVAFATIAAHTVEPDMFLDIGCGNGHTIEYFDKRWGNTEYYGLDLSDVAVDLARQRVPDAMFACGTFEDAQLPYCDVVVIMGVLEHFENLDAALQYLKISGDLIYVECPNCLGYSDSQSEGFRQTHEGAGQNEWHLRRETWEQRITDAGFRIVESIQGFSAPTEFIWVLK